MTVDASRSASSVLTFELHSVDPNSSGANQRSELNQQGGSQNFSPLCLAGSPRQA